MGMSQNNLYRGDTIQSWQLKKSESLWNLMETKTKRQNKVKPTPLQFRAVNLLLENQGKISIGEAMRNAGYTIASAKNPKALTESRGFQELMEEHLPDDMLLAALSTDIKSKVGNRKAELELAFKVKGKLGQADRPPDPGGNTYNTFINNSTINPNAPKAKELAEETLRILMEKTKVPPTVQNT